MHVLQVCDKIFFFQSMRLEKHVHMSKIYYIRKVGGGGGISWAKKKDWPPVYNFHSTPPLMHYTTFDYSVYLQIRVLIL